MANLTLELRNRIYEFAMMMEADRGHISLVHVENNETPWGFTGLMSTYRQVRSEFPRDSHISVTKFDVNVQDLGKFSRGFLTNTSPRLVHVYLVDENGELHEMLEMNMKPVLNGIFRSDRGFVTFFDTIDSDGYYGQEPTGLASILNTVFRFKERWARALENNIHAIALDLSPGHEAAGFVCEVKFTPNKEFTALWQYQQEFFWDLYISSNAWHNFYLEALWF